MLGVGPCYHMVDVLGDLPRAKDWSAALAGNANWDEVFAGYQSTVDWPGSFFYRELREAYPDAKVLLSVRPGEAWARSMTGTISSILYGDSLMYDLSSARCRIDPAWNDYIELMRDMWHRSGLLPDRGDTSLATLAREMERYNDEVRSTFDDVVEWTPADGWGPICELLEVPVPDAPFPHVNNAEVFEDRIVDSALAALNAWRAQAAAPAAG
jgi:Sulfotransferase domain